MKNPAQYLYLIPLTASMICSLKTWRDRWAGSYRVFSVFLTATFLMEIFAVSWKLGLHSTAYWDFPKQNLWIYNLYFIPEYLFYIFFYSSVSENRKQGKSGWYLAIVFAIFSLANIFMIQGIEQLDTFSIILGSGILIACAASYFIQELNRKIPRAVGREPLFWISLGTLVFHAVSLPYFIFINYLSRTNLSLEMALFNILLILNILMYICYLIAFLCKNPVHRKSF